MHAKISKLLFSPAGRAAEPGLFTRERCVSLAYSLLSRLTGSLPLLLCTAQKKVAKKYRKMVNKMN